MQKMSEPMYPVSLPHPKTEQKIASLFHDYTTLNDQEKLYLCILSVVYKPIGIKKFEQIISRLVGDGVLSGPANLYFLSVPRRDTLVKLGLLHAGKIGLQVNRLLATKLTQEFLQLPVATDMNKWQKMQSVIMATEAIAPVSMYSSANDKAIEQYRIVRNLFFMGGSEQLITQFTIHKNPQIIDYTANEILIELLFMPFDLTQFLALPKPIQYNAIATLIREHQKRGENVNYPIKLLEEVCTSESEQPASIHHQACYHLLAEQYLYTARLDEAKRLLNDDDDSFYGLQLLGVYQFLKGNNTAALKHFKQALIAKNKLNKRKQHYLNEIPGYFYKLALIVSANNDEPGQFTVATEQITLEESERKFKGQFSSVGRGLISTIRNLSTGNKYNVLVDYHCVPEQEDALCHHLIYFNYLLSHIWCNASKEKELADLASQYRKKFDALGYQLFAEFCLQMVDSIMSLPAKNTHYMANICNLVSAKPEWDLALDRLIALAPATEIADKPTLQHTKPVRLIWEFDPNFHFNMQAREQKHGKSGWSKGRVVSLKRLKDEWAQFDYLTDSDKRICRAIVAYQGWGYYAKTTYALEGVSAIRAAVGIDNLYCSNNLSQPVDLTEAAPELMISQQGEDLCITIPHLSESFHFDDSSDAYHLQEMSATHYQLIVFSEEHIKVGNIIGETGLLVPLTAKQKALNGIAAIAPFLNIQSDIAELDTGLETTDCDPNLFINIQPYEQGLSFTCVVMPFGEAGPSYKPAVGNTNITTDLAGQRVATKRDLQGEEALLDQLDEACPAFLGMSDNVLLADDLSAALEVLEQLEDVAQSGQLDLVLRWPKGKKLSLTNKLGSEHLQLSIGKNKEWFDITGELQINQEDVLSLRKLLELVSTNNGRFIELDANQILVLSEDLRDKLEQINKVTDEGTFHPLASLQMEEATSGMRMKTLHAWEKQTQKMHQANDITPVLPSTFQGQLRDYQLAGFDWALRLAHWGAGACLADDMGLGKTLQALAMMLYRANNGPALVIAPTSVCFNWQQEALKFAPTIKMHLFADATNTEQREALLSCLGPFDCVIISYGLLQRESERLNTVHWHTIVADEAQALKNPLAKRTKAAYALKGDFKLITTGTPVENDLTELWSLFRFINPGLLGNIKRFGERFALPMENAKEDKLAAHRASQGLKTLIQPFILRRMKNQVLEELPPRTDITIAVKMSDTEQAFYEALRLNAIDNLSSGEQKSNLGEQRIKMLAELMKLRQACCNPRLVSPEMNIPSAKLAALHELLQELKLNNHKALIFSQFVGHLQLIKEHVEANGFSYQYLDGSTPQKERQKRVNAFQSGIGDLFLISLKAGGSGLNLTAADYVIHMDPWWNPAVEEQASDRAHRLGQKRPVTIYRLVAQNTIEEKIVALHQHKRDLADKVLSGNEVATKLSVDDMLVLLKDTF